MKYVVSYDLVDADSEDYTRLTDEIIRLGGVRIMMSQWVLVKNNTAKEIRLHLHDFIDTSKDRLLVNALDGRDWSALNMKTKISDI